MKPGVVRPGGHGSRVGPRPRRAVMLGLVFGTLTVLGVLGFGSLSSLAARRDISLYATTFGGWGTAPGAETNPGPTIRVDMGDDVHMMLTSEDPPPGGHTFWIDYDNDGMIDLVTEPSSPEFTSTILFGFTANTPGTFTYYCSIHSGPPYSPTGSIMRGTWTTRGPPTVAIADPVASSSWSGGAPREIKFNLGGSEPPENMTVWVNYSASSGTVGGPIAGPIPGTPNPNLVSWTTAAIDAVDVVVNVTAMDRGGRKGYGTSPPFEVDSTRPAIVSTVPSAGAIGIAPNALVRVIWSEGMNRSATGSVASFGVVRISDGAWTPGSTAWSSDSRQMTFMPSAVLDPFSVYEAHVNASGKDDSEPGNAVTAPLVWQFTTGDVVDTTPPRIASVAAQPPAQAQDRPVNLTADVTDDRAVGTVSVRVIGPSFDMNLTMTHASGGTWFVNRSYSANGAYSFTVWAEDGSGNLASRSGSFSIGDATATPERDIDLLPWAAAAAIAASSILVGIFWARRRRVRGRDE